MWNLKPLKLEWAIFSKLWNKFGLGARAPWAVCVFAPTWVASFLQWYFGSLCSIEIIRESEAAAETLLQSRLVV